MKKKTKKQEVKPEVTYIKIFDSGETYVTQEADPDDEWSRDSTDSTVSINGFAIKKETEWYDLIVPFKIEKEKEYFLLYVIYSTGDSFGTDGGKVQYIDLFEKEEDAKENQKRINEHYKRYCKVDSDGTAFRHKHFSPFSVKLTNPAGKPYDCSVSWTGYFEGLTDVVIEPIKQILPS